MRWWLFAQFIRWTGFAIAAAFWYAVIYDVLAVAW